MLSRISRGSSRKLAVPGLGDLEGVEDDDLLALEVITTCFVFCDGASVLTLCGALSVRRSWRCSERIH